MIETNDMDMDTLDLEFVDVDITELTRKSCENCVYVDVQGFKTSRNRFMCKEFCMVDGDFIYHALVKSPFPFKKMAKYYQRQATWLTDNHHKIRYDSGDIHIHEMRKDILPRLMNKTIIVKGSHKVSWVQQIFENCDGIYCMNIEDFEDFEPFERNSQLFDLCYYHNNVFTSAGVPCAKSIALMIQDFVLKRS